MNNLQIKLLSPKATKPTRGTSGSAGLDLYCTETCAIEDGKVSVISTGVAVKIPFGYVGLIKPRSGLALKHGADTMAGVIDSDYRGEIKMMLTTHDGCKHVQFDEGDRIAQLVIVPCFMGEVAVVCWFDDTERGSGGFGSTGE
jgi:deoxyuridine 5'-triphosphate nucleotidohydrolase